MKVSASTLRENLLHDPTSAADSSWSHLTGTTYDSGSKYVSFPPKEKLTPDKWYDWTNDPISDKFENVEKAKKKGGGKIYREVDEKDYLILTIQRLEKEIGELTYEVISRINHWVLTCINCGFKDVLTEFMSANLGTGGNRLKCPNCRSKAVGIPKDEEHKLIKEILKGSEGESE